MKIHFIGILIVIQCFSTVALCDPSLTVGVLAELTGPEAANGKACHDGYRVAQKIFASHSRSNTLRVVFGDHQAQSHVALTEFQRMTETEHAAAIISNRGHIGVALDPVSKRKKIPLLGIMGHAEFLQENPYGIRYWVPLELDGKMLAETVADKGLRKVAIVALHDDYILAFVSAFRSAFQARGGEVIFADTIDNSLADFSSLVSRIRAAKPDVIFLNAAVSQLGTLVRRVREQGLTQQIISNFWIAYDDVINSAGEQNIEGAIYTSMNLQKPKFEAALKTLDASSRSSAVTYACYSALAAIYQVVEEHPEVSDAAALWVTLQEMSALKLADETIRIQGREVFFDIAPHVIHSGHGTRLILNRQ